MFGQHGKMGGVSSFEVLKQLSDLPWISSMIPPSEARNATCDSTKMKRATRSTVPTKKSSPPPKKKNMPTPIHGNLVIQSDLFGMVK